MAKEDVSWLAKKCLKNVLSKKFWDEYDEWYVENIIYHGGDFL